MRVVLIIIFCCLVSKNTYAQSNNGEALLYNVGLGGVGSGIGAIINKRPNQKTGKVFIEGFWQGSLGGVLVFTSKKMSQEIAFRENFTMAWPSKIVNAAGTSIIENAANNRDFWERWHLNVGFNYLEINTKDKLEFRYKLRPISMAIAMGTAINSKFELKRSLQIGDFVFSANEKYMPNASAIVIGNVVRVRTQNLSNYDLFSHEIVHIYQKNDFNVFNSYFVNKMSVKNENSYFKKISFYFDIEFEYLSNGLFYGLEALRVDDGSQNFFEREAIFYTKRKIYGGF